MSRQYGSLSAPFDERKSSNDEALPTCNLLEELELHISIQQSIVAQSDSYELFGQLFNLIQFFFGIKALFCETTHD